jgi:NAD(P)-dependent dehydrogenase (short-subunit alcohol dehydrogenase family)
MSTVAVVTGVSTGLGHATAEALLRQGWRVIGVSRDEERSRLAYERLRPIADEAGGTIELVRADLARQVEVRALAAALSGEPRIDALVHGAGALFGRRRETDEGREQTFALNHLAPFLLTCLLRGRLFPAGRVVSINSRLHTRGRINFDDLDGVRGYRALGAYAQAKLANLLFTYELARRQPAAAVNAVFPGDVYTNAARYTGPVTRAVYRVVGSLLFLPPAKGADTVVWAASSSEAARHNGELLYRRAPRTSSPASHDRAVGERLWTVSADLTGVTWD